MNLPITHVTLYKHGVGFFQRRAALNGDKLELTFRAAEMNDVLKSLTAIDWGEGQVLGVEYPTPQTSQERLAGCSIRLDPDRSLRDLVAGLRGRSVRLVLDQQEEARGVLLGLDEVGERQPLATCLVSLLRDGTQEVQAVSLARLQALEILDERGAHDLRFFLDATLVQEETRPVVVRLSPGEHDLAVSYIAPAPTWRVSYRLVSDPGAPDASAALLQGWGIFDNRLEEDLDGISLSLVAGMPISFVYDLYTPFTPERPVVEEEARVAAAPVEFAAAKAMDAVAAPPPPAPGMGLGAAVRSMAPAPARQAISREALERGMPAAAAGESLGELFQYVVSTPVTVRRGHSAMVPIVSARLECQKHLLYNGAKMARHPVATLRLVNGTGLTLERGPVTVVQGGEYVGEAVLPFTVSGGEVVVPYAVELGCRLREEAGTAREIRGLGVAGIYLRIEEWDIRWHDYLASNTTGEPLTVLVEHPRLAQYELFETPEPKERSTDHLRFEVQIPAQGEARLRVQERRLTSRREEVRQQSYPMLQHYLHRGLLDQPTHDQLAELLGLWEKIAQAEKRLGEVDAERAKIYKAQQQVQGNMGALSTTGKEGSLRARYVEQLEATENQLRTLDGRESALKAEIERLKAEVDARVKALE